MAIQDSDWEHAFQMITVITENEGSCAWRDSKIVPWLAWGLGGVTISLFQYIKNSRKFTNIRANQELRSSKLKMSPMLAPWIFLRQLPYDTSLGVIPIFPLSFSSFRRIFVAKIHYCVGNSSSSCFLRMQLGISLTSFIGNTNLSRMTGSL